VDSVIANLELLPRKLNQNKNDTFGNRQLAHPQKLYQVDLLSVEGLKKSQSTGRGRLLP